MTIAALSITDVHQALEDRIAAGAYPVGSRLPACRALAADLGTNPSTVDRALQRLAFSGVVRTVPRRGTYVEALPGTAMLGASTVATELVAVLGRARRAGVPVDAIRSIVDEVLAADVHRPRVALVECNARDLQRVCALVEDASGVVVEPVLIDQLGDRSLDEEFDLVAAPIFHLHDLAGHVGDLDRVVALNMIAGAPVLRRLALLDEHRRVAVAAPTERGLDRMSALVHQYHPGDLRQFHVGVDDPAALRDVDVLVRTNAGDLPPEAAAVPEVLAIEWELEPGFAAWFRGRVAAAGAGTDL